MSHLEKTGDTKVNNFNKFCVRNAEWRQPNKANNIDLDRMPLFRKFREGKRFTNCDSDSLSRKERKMLAHMEELFGGMKLNIQDVSLTNCVLNKCYLF